MVGPPSKPLFRRRLIFGGSNQRVVQKNHFQQSRIRWNGLIFLSAFLLRSLAKTWVLLILSLIGWVTITWSLTRPGRNRIETP